MNQKISKNNEKLKQVLIVSYSYTGNTHKIAQEIQKLTGGDLCEIYSWQPYPMAFPELLAQVKREIAAGYRPRLLAQPYSPKNYSAIFVGSPNWCGTIAPPLTSWLYSNDLSGKRLFPFYSHCGGNSGDFRGDIVKLCPKSEVREALSVVENSEEWRNIDQKILRWLNALQCSRK